LISIFFSTTRFHLRFYHIQLFYHITVSSTVIEDVTNFNITQKILNTNSILQFIFRSEI